MKGDEYYSDREVEQRRLDQEQKDALNRKRIALLQYIEAIGGTRELNIFDGGQSWTVRVGAAQFRAGYQWGEEWQFYTRVKTWLDLQPWPTEDDPRAITSAGIIVPEPMGDDA